MCNFRLRDPIVAGLQGLNCRWVKKKHSDLAEVAVRAQTAAVCLISALAYHGITTQIPSSIHLTLSAGG